MNGEKMFNEDQMLAENGSSATLSKKNWACFICLGFLNIIPFIGSIAYLVILIYLTVKKETATSLRNYLIVFWCMLAIAVAITIIWMIILVVFLGAQPSITPYSSL